MLTSREDDEDNADIFSCFGMENRKQLHLLLFEADFFEKFLTA